MEIFNYLSKVVFESKYQEHLLALNISNTNIYNQVRNKAAAEISQNTKMLWLVGRP